MAAGNHDFRFSAIILFSWRGLEIAEAIEVVRQIRIFAREIRRKMTPRRTSDPDAEPSRNRVAILALALGSLATGNLPRARMAFERFSSHLPAQLARMKAMMRRPEDFDKFSNAIRTLGSL